MKHAKSFVKGSLSALIDDAVGPAPATAPAELRTADSLDVEGGVAAGSDAGPAEEARLERVESAEGINGAPYAPCEAMRWVGRKQVLLALCQIQAGGGEPGQSVCGEPGRTGGRANVSMLCQHTGLELKRVSSHLANLRLRGLVCSRQEGLRHWYTAHPKRVRYEVKGDRFVLTLMEDGGESGMMLFGPVPALREDASKAGS